jgi:hypothetical protein
LVSGWITMGSVSYFETTCRRWVRNVSAFRRTLVVPRCHTMSPLCQDDVRHPV